MCNLVSKYSNTYPDIEEKTKKKGVEKKKSSIQIFLGHILMVPLKGIL
jgi:hypothetical protein